MNTFAATRRGWLAATVAGAVSVCVWASTCAAEYPFVFRDVGDECGLFPAVAGIRGHAAAWGDVDGDGWPDLFVGTFYVPGAKPSQLLRNRQGKFRPDDQQAVPFASRASGAVFVDLDNRGCLDLYVSNNAQNRGEGQTTPNVLLRNDGAGRFTDVSARSGASPPGFMGRSVAALDFDGDGLLDLAVAEFYYGPRAQTGLALYRNLGGLRFEEVAGAVGLPTGEAVAGVAVADVNADTWPDLFLTFADGSNRLMLNDGRGRFREAPGTREVFAWKVPSADSSPTGVCIADVSRDGLPEIVIGHHFKYATRDPAPVRLYLHTGVRNGNPTYQEITQQAGLTPLAMKAPHVEIQDFDNDGWPDIYVSIVKFKDRRACPVIFRNLGLREGTPRFRDDAWQVNDFPTAADRASKGSREAFARILDDRKILYSAAAPSADFDRDGRLDLLLTMFSEEARSLLLRNETPGGNWLAVSVRGSGRVNRMGIGAQVKVYRAGELGQAGALLGQREIAVGYGWCSGQEAVAHFGLGSQQLVDVELVLPHNRGTLVRKGLKTNQRIALDGPLQGRKT